MPLLFRGLCVVLLFAGVELFAEETSPALPRGAPTAQGVDARAVLDFVVSAEAKIDALHSFMLVRHGQVVAEGWWAPQAATKPHVLNSLTKSFTSTAVGFAVAEGKLTLDDPVLKFFPEDAPAEPSENLRALNVRHLLTMATGHAKADIDSFPYRSWPFFPSKNLVKAFFAMPFVAKPGTEFIYDSAGSYMLSAIVQKVTGRSVRDYLGPRLFAPLGIATPTWDLSAQAVCYGGFGLYLRTEDIAKFGQLYLRKGEWQGKQLIAPNWVEAATSKQISNGKGDDGAGDWGQGYGYQFWRCRHGFYRGDGARGQFCIVMPQYDAVLAITADTNDMGGVMNLVWEKLVPALGATPLPDGAANDAALATKLKSLKLK